MKQKTSRSGLSTVAIGALAIGVLAAGLIGWLVFYRHPRIGRIRNVVLISIDTCRADHLSCYGYRRRTTPNIDAIARDGVLFKQALTPVPLTTPAHSSIMTGTYPPTHGVHLNDGERLAESNMTLTKILRASGFQTAAFVGGFPMDSRFGLNQGFDTYDCMFTIKREKSAYGTERTADEVNRPALTWLQKHAGKPFFVFLHYFDAHTPYEPPLPYAADYVSDPYAGEIAYVDHCIGDVMERLRALGSFDNTLIIITGDHGEGLGEHGEPCHGYFIYQSTLHVPLMIRVPHGSKGREIEGHVSLVDIMPTVLDLVGLKVPQRVEGVSLRPSLETGSTPDPLRSIYCESLDPATYQCSPLHGIIEAGWKYIRTPREELYQLQDDYGEQINRIKQDSQVARGLRGRLDAMLQKMETSAPLRDNSVVDPESIRRLQSLGYVGGGIKPAVFAFDPTQEDPKDFLATYKRFENVQLLFFSNRNKEAEEELREIMRDRPTCIAAYSMLARIAQNEHRLADATDYSTKVIKIIGELTNSSKQASISAGHMFDIVLAQTHLDLGNALSQIGKMNDATGHFEQALRLRPDYLEAHENLGLSFLHAGRFTEAIEHLEQALRFAPDSVDAHVNLGLSLLQVGKLTEAIEHYEQALRIKPNHANAHVNLGLALAQAGKLTEAIEHYGQALRIKPDFANVHWYLGTALQQAGKFAEAIGHYEEALRILPDSPEPLNNLAWIRATNEDSKLRDGTEAVRLAEHACRLTRRTQATTLDTLGTAYAEAGRFSEAMATAEEAIALATASKQTTLVNAIQSRIDLYRTGHPFRDSP